jgi:hypothetical protein
MKVMCDSFFFGLGVDSRYYLRQFKRLGIQNRFYFDSNDLQIIVSDLPTPRYKSVLVVERAKSFLKGFEDVKIN